MKALMKLKNQIRNLLMLGSDIHISASFKTTRLASNKRLIIALKLCLNSLVFLHLQLLLRSSCLLQIKTLMTSRFQGTSRRNILTLRKPSLFQVMIKSIMSLGKLARMIPSFTTMRLRLSKEMKESPKRDKLQPESTLNLLKIKTLQERSLRS